MLMTFFLKVLTAYSYISTIFPLCKIKQPQSFRREKIQYVVLLFEVALAYEAYVLTQTVYIYLS